VGFLTKSGAQRDSVEIEARQPRIDVALDLGWRLCRLTATAAHIAKRIQVCPASTVASRHPVGSPKGAFLMLVSIVESRVASGTIQPWQGWGYPTISTNSGNSPLIPAKRWRTRREAYRICSGSGRDLRWSGSLMSFSAGAASAANVKEFWTIPGGVSTKDALPETLAPADPGGDAPVRVRRPAAPRSRSARRGRPRGRPGNQSFVAPDRGDN
jgi:hypothetical protein